MKKYLFYVLLIASQANAHYNKIDSLKNVLNGAKQDSSIASKLLSISDEYSELNPDSALYYSNLAIQFAQRFNNYDALGYAYNSIGQIQLNNGNNENAETNFLKAFSFYQRTSNKKGIGKVLSNLGTAEINQGETDSALSHYEAALQILMELKSKRDIAAVYSNIAGLYYQKGDYTKCLDYMLQALKVSETLGDDLRLAKDYTNLASIYSEIKDYNSAINFNNKAFRIFEKLNNNRSLAIAYCNIGNSYFGLNNFETAKGYLEKGLAISSEINNTEGIATAYNGLGRVYEELNEKEKALRNYLLAQKLFEVLDNKADLLSVYENIGNLYVQQKKYDDGIRMLGKSLFLAYELDSKDALQNIYQDLSLAYEKKGDYRKSLSYFKHWAQQKDSVLNIDKLNQITEMQTKYETEKKDAEIALLNKDKELQAKQNTLYKTAAAGVGVVGILSVILILSRNRRRRDTMEKRMTEVQMQALRAQMNPHFIFNSLNSIMRFVRNNDAASAEKYLGKFAKLIRMILENSREREVPLESDLQALQLYMELESLRLENKFQYSINVEDDIDKDSTYIAPMMLQPFVENSIWHGISNKEDKGNIAIRIKKQEELLHCEIEDDGVGRSNSIIASEAKQSLGYAITKERVELMNNRMKKKAHVKVVDLPKGTKVLVSLPYFAEAANKN